MGKAANVQLRRRAVEQQTLQSPEFCKTKLQILLQGPAYGRWGSPSYFHCSASIFPAPLSRVSVSREGHASKQNLIPAGFAEALWQEAFGYRTGAPGIGGDAPTMKCAAGGSLQFAHARQLARTKTLHIMELRMLLEVPAHARNGVV